jgi:hypothetical protein
MDEMLMRLLGTLWIAALTDLPPAERAAKNDVLLEMAERESTPYPDSQILRVIAQSAAGRKVHNDPHAAPVSHLRLVQA